MSNIVIQQSDKDSNVGSEYILLYVYSEDEVFHGGYGVIRRIIDAYNNVTLCSEHLTSSGDAGEIQKNLNALVRYPFDFAAGSIVHAGGFLPVSQLAYEEYAKQGFFYDAESQYIVTVFDYEDHDGDIKWELTLKHESGLDITRGIKECVLNCMTSLVRVVPKRYCRTAMMERCRSGRSIWVN